MTLSQFPSKKIYGVVQIVDAIVDLLKKGIIAKTNVASNVTIGDTVISINNAFQFRPDDEIVLIDHGYNQEGHVHNNIFEYSKIKHVNNTNSVTVYQPVEGEWNVSDGAFVQKTVGHSPLYEGNVYYGDRAVIPMDQMAITVEPMSLSTEWLYIQGGLNQEYKLTITVYGKDAKMEEGKRIVDLYTDQVVQLLNENMHMNVDGFTTPLVSDLLSGESMAIIADTPENRENFDPSASIYVNGTGFELQDNKHANCWNVKVNSMSYGGGLLYLTLDSAVGEDYLLSEYAVIRRTGRYIWDSRASAATYGTIQKESGLLRGAQIEWYCKWVNDYRFPQVSKRVDNFDEIAPDESSSSSSED